MDIKEIARLSGVSEGTVDRVLHNRSGVAEKTKLKITALLKKHNYTPNMIAQSLSLKKNYTIGVLIPDFKDSIFWLEIEKGIIAATNEFKAFGLHVQLYKFTQYNKKEYEKSLQKIIASKPSGIILIPLFVDISVKLLLKANKLKIPYFFVNVNLDIEPFKKVPYIGQDSFRSGFFAAKIFSLFIKETPSNNKKILIIDLANNTNSHTNIYERIQGFKSFFKQSSIPIGIEEIVYKNTDEKYLKEKTKNLLSIENDIHGIFIPSSKIYRIVKYFPQLKNKIIIAGYDLIDENLKLLQNNAIDFLIGQEPYEQGYNSIKKMFNFLANKIYPETNTLSSIRFYIKENIDIVKNNKLI